MKIVISSTSLSDDELWDEFSSGQPIFYPQARPDISAANSDLFASSCFREVAARRLTGAVRIPSTTYDKMGRVGTDPRWDVFYTFTKYLRDTFPALYEKLNVTTINEHGLLYTWIGSDKQSKPLLLMAHSDVVPVPSSTAGRWTYPPFSGQYDGEYVWGRGSEDDKSNLIAILSAIDALLSVDFRPSRTVIVSIGFDEEGGADKSYGARCLAEHLLQVYGEDGIEMFDEGVVGIQEHFGTEFAMPATAEKGYIDVEVTIDTAGGHSSTPPDHTAIGYLAQIIGIIEGNPFKSRLTDQNPTTVFLKYAALHSKNMPLHLREAILDQSSRDKVVKYLDSSIETRALIRTSTAVDVIEGGDKANSLPERAYTLVNHRIATEDSIQILKDHYIRILSPFAKKWDFKLLAFGRELSWASEPAGTVTLTGHDELEPSPVTDHRDVQFSWLSGTLRSVFGEKLIVAPVLLTGNTDTKFFWKLSAHIYRMSPWRAKLDPRGSNMHTVDERMHVTGLLEMIRFYHEFIRVVDEKRV